MGLFGKKKMSEREAAEVFVNTIVITANEQWPAIVGQLNETSKLSSGVNLGFDYPETAANTFAIAVMAVELQALENLLPARQAARVREHSLEAMSAWGGPQIVAAVRSAVDVYQREWDGAISAGEMPIHAVSNVLTQKLGCSVAREIGGETFNDPILIMAFSEKVITLVGGLWKSITESRKLVP